MTIRPFVFVGLGGTGGKTLGVVYWQLRAVLDRAGIREWPNGWQFLHIDVASDPDPAIPGTPGNLPREHYLPLTDRNTTYVGVDNIIDSTLHIKGLDRHLAWQSWRPHPAAKVPVPIHKGAGQFRALGRSALQANLEKVNHAIAEAFAKLKLPDRPHLSEVQTALGQKPQPTQDDPLVFVVGSVAGGSGSGMFLDVCDLLRTVPNVLPYGIIFTPEVFTGANGALEGGLAPNSFLALSELSNAMWTALESDQHQSREALFARARSARPIGRGGPELALLVGRKSEGITLANADAVYSAVGRSLAELVLNEDLAQAVANFLVTNGPSNAIMGIDHLGLAAGPNQPAPALFRGMGFGRLTVGRDLFERYAAERLLRLTSLRLLDQHLNLRFTGDERTDDEIIEAATEVEWGRFSVASGLAEVGPELNQVTDALTPDIDAALSGGLRRLQEQILARAEVGGFRHALRISARQAREDVVAFVNAGSSASEGGVAVAQREIHAKARAWSVQIHWTVERAVVNAATAHGLPVAMRLLQRLREDVRLAAADLRDNEARRARAAAAQLSATLPTLAEGEAEYFSPEDTATIQAYVRGAATVLRQYISAEVAEVAAVMMEDCAANLLEPWARALADADGLLRLELRPAVGASRLDIWPRESGVPDHLNPSRLEVSLDPVEEFPDVFVELVTRSVKTDEDDPNFLGDAPAQAQPSRVESGVTEILRGAEISKQNLEALTHPVSAYRVMWIPTPQFARGAAQQSSRARVRLGFAVEDLSERIYAWIRSDTKVIGRFLRHSLADWLTDDSVTAATLKKRQQILVAQYEAMLRLAHPLLGVDSDLHGQIHGSQKPAVTSFAAPLNVPSDLVDLRQDLLAVSSASSGGMPTLTFTSAASASSQIVTFLTQPCHLLEVTSIMAPIAGPWNAGRNENMWLYRRSRPLGEWVPLSPAARQLLVLGWLAARLLGAAGTTQTVDGVQLQVHTPKGWQTLPVGNTPRKATKVGAVGTLLELIPSLFVDAYSTKSLAPLEPIGHLISLGRSIHEAENPIATWLQTGQGLVDPARSRLHLDHSHEATRVQEMSEILQALRDEYTSDVSAAKLTVSDFGNPPVIAEVFHDVIRGLDRLEVTLRTRTEDVER